MSPVGFSAAQTGQAELMRTSRLGAITVAACTAIGTATACGSSNDDGGITQTSSPTAAGTSTASTSASGSRLDQAVRAVRTAGRNVGSGKAYDIESDRLR